MYQKNKLKMTSFSQPKNNTGSLLIITSKNGLNSTKNLSLEEESNNNLKVHNTISNLIDVINENNLNFFYQDNTSSFKYNIDQLNLKFYLETEKILSSTEKTYHNENKLFLILFKQINLYIREIERLNTVLIDQAKEPNKKKKKMVIISQKKSDLETKEMLIQTLKTTIKSLEKKLSKLIFSENNLKEENEKLKKEIKHYKELYENYSIGLSSISNSTTIQNKRKRTFSDFNQSNLNNATMRINKTLKNDFTVFNKSTQKKSISKLKIIKAVKSKVSNSSNKKNYSNISNSNTTSITNNINSNSGSNRSSNLVDENGNVKNQKISINITKIKKNNSNSFNFHHFHSNSNNLPSSHHDNVSFSVLNNRNVIINKEIEDLEQIQDLLNDVKDYFLEKCNNEIDFVTLLNDNNNNPHISFENNFENSSSSGKEKNMN